MIASVSGSIERVSRRRLAVHSALIAGILVLSGLALLVTSRNAAATTVDYYDQRGYQGNAVIYLNTGVVGTNPISIVGNLPTATGSQPRQTWNDEINNVVNLIVGSGAATSSGTMKFQETFMGSGSNYLYVVIPVTALGATRKWWTTPSSPAPAMVQYSTLGVQVSNGDVPTADNSIGRWQVNTQTDTTYNSGVNVTGPYNPGASYANWQSLASIALGVGCFIIPGYDFVCATTSFMLDTYGLLSGVYSGPTPIVGNGQSSERYYVTKGGAPVQTPAAPSGEAKDVFATDMLLKVQIPYDPVTNQFPFTPSFTFNAWNWVEDPYWPYDGWYSLDLGANATVTLNSAPAVLVTGTVYDGARTLANYPVVLSTYNPSPYITINYHLTTDSGGRYSFFAPLGAPYQLYAGYSSPFGSGIASVAFTTDSHPDTQNVDLRIPAFYGHVYNQNGGSSQPVGGAQVTLTTPSAQTYSLTTDPYGLYSINVVASGTYAVRVRATYFDQATVREPIVSNPTDFYLQPAYGFRLLSCGTLYVYTYSQGTCTITVTSVGGWVGTVALTIAAPSGISGTLSSYSVPLSTAWGQGTTVATITTGAATGTFQVSGSGSGPGTDPYPLPGASPQGYAITVVVSNPPSGGGGGGCVLSGTLVLTPDGVRSVDQLSTGDTILGYNVATESWVQETVTSNTPSYVSQILSINRGLLKVTLTDQPLFVRNGTWMGWVHDPLNLRVGEQLFLPLADSWLTITSLQTLEGSFKVYDLRATAPNDFVANGVLADYKI